MARLKKEDMSAGEPKEVHIEEWDAEILIRPMTPGETDRYIASSDGASISAMAEVVMNCTLDPEFDDPSDFSGYLDGMSEAFHAIEDLTRRKSVKEAKGNSEKTPSEPSPSD